MHMLTVSDRWLEEAGGASVGLLCVVNVPNLPDHKALESARKQLVQDLNARYRALDRPSIRELPVFSAYDTFYRSFRKTYHVQLQLESVVHQGKPIHSPSALVGAMFMAELKTGLLTAGHDLSALKLPLTADIARGEEVYQRLDGTNQTLKAGDLYIRDQQSVISSVIYGPDHRTRIQLDTDQVVFTTYGPPGITREQIREELKVLEGYLRCFTPHLERQSLEVS